MLNKLYNDVNDKKLFMLNNEINVEELRNFQRKPLLEQYDLIKDNEYKKFKVTPPNHNNDRVQMRINNKFEFNTKK